VRVRVVVLMRREVKVRENLRPEQPQHNEHSPYHVPKKYEPDATLDRAGIWAGFS
jgi:hypothetical protein